MHVILIAVISLGVIAVVLAAILYAASKKFSVYEDPRIGQVAAVLPQANCGGCGYPGCSGFADACVKLALWTVNFARWVGRRLWRKSQIFSA